MKLYVCSAVLLLVQLAAADHVIDINKQADQLLSSLDSLLTQRGYGLQQFASLEYGGIKLSNLAFVGGNSYYRTGDSTLRVNADNSSYSVDLHIGNRLFVTAFGSLKLKDDDFSGLVRINKNSFHLALTIQNPKTSSCQVRLDSYEYESLDNAVLSASIPEYDGQDVSATLANVLLDINKKLDQAKPDKEKILKSFLCRVHVSDVIYGSRNLVNLATAVLLR